MDDQVPNSEKTIGEILDGMTDLQKAIIYYLVGRAKSGKDCGRLYKKYIAKALDVMTEEQREVVCSLIGMAILENETKEENQNGENSGEL